ncbi:MAG: extracellular solute-binding protein [Alphaproteobacteria bacterium ADurb.Bin438]|nr:MAG: extracellular solute-binding protein [Alphaproteobacteria bacterium ADurb.Bin438]
MKYFLFLLVLLSSFPTFAQRRIEEVVKKEKVEVDTRFDINKFKTSCGKRELPFAIVGSLNYPPFSWIIEEQVSSRDTKKVLIGIGVDYFNHISSKIFKNSHHSSDIIVNSDEEISKSMLRGSADFFINAYYDNNPSLGVDYIFPSYLTNHMIVVLRKDDDKTKIEKVEDLVNYKGVIRSDEYTDWIYKGIGIDINFTDKVIIKNDSKEALTSLLKGEVDYFFTGIYSARAEVTRYKLFDEVKIIENSLKANRIFFTLSKMSKCRDYKALFDKAIEDDINDNETIKKIVLENILKYVEQFKDEPKLTVEKETTPPIQTNEEIAKP